MKYAIITDGKVVNIVLAEPDVAEERGWMECPEETDIGWDYDGTIFIDNRPEPVVLTPPAPTKEELLQQLQTLTQQIQSLT